MSTNPIFQARNTFNVRHAVTTVIACGVCIGTAGAQRAVVPDRIGWREPHGGSDFAKSLHTLSEQGRLDGTTTINRGHGHSHKRFYRPHHWGYGYSYPGPRVYDRYDPYYGYPYGIDNRVVYGVQPGSRLAFPSGQTNANQNAAAGQGTQSQPAPAPLTPVQEARVDLEAERYDEAITRYRALLAEDDADFRVAAELGVALIGAGRFDDAVSMMRLAYSSDPGLAVEPLSLRLDLPDKTWRELVVRSVRHGHKRGTPAAWLTVAVLMQAQGRPEVAMRMLDRARDLGLDDEILTPLAAVLR